MSSARVDRIIATAAALRARIKRLVLKAMPSETQHVFALTLLIGVVCGFAAVGFHLSIGLVEKLTLQRGLRALGSWWMLWSILIPAFGGLIGGIALTYLVPGARGSGIPGVKVAYALREGRVPLRDTVGKFVLCAVQIGTGGSLGREGPTVQICAGTASLLARATWLPLRSMRRLTPVGVAAGIAAAFNAPIAAVTFTIEEIVGTLDQTVLSGVVVAAALAAVIERSVLGVHPVIEVGQSFTLEHASSLPFYLLLGVAAAFVSILFTDSLLALRAAFRRLKRVPEAIRPALGGAVTGALAVIMIRFYDIDGIHGGGYAAIGGALAGKLAVDALAVLCLAKVAATVFSYSSGGAGGIFAPSLCMGAALGGVLGYVDVAALHHHGGELGAFALVGMGAVFAGVVRAPITSVLIIFEMTGGYGLVLPLMIANMTAYGLARRWRPVGVYDALLAQDGIHLPHGAAPTREPMLQEPVRDVVTRSEALSPSTPMRELMDRLVASSVGAIALGADEAGNYGVVVFDQMRELWRDPTLDAVLVAADVARRVQALPIEGTIADALRHMDAERIDALPIIDGDPGSPPIGVVTRADIGRHLLQQYAMRRPSPSSRSGLHAAQPEPTPDRVA
jgi:CIC family chloride channel protein